MEFNKALQDAQQAITTATRSTVAMNNNAGQAAIAAAILALAVAVEDHGSATRYAGR